MMYIEQQEESLPQIVTIQREKILQIIFLGTYNPIATPQNPSEQDFYFDSKGLIALVRNAIDLYDQSDSKGKMSFIGFKGKDRLKSAAN